MREFIKAIFAGIMIGIAGMVYISVPEKYVGAIMFSVGLIVICYFDYNLYTGKIGYAQSHKDVPFLLKCIVGNLIGVFFVALSSSVNTRDMVVSKLNVPLCVTFLRGILCGFLMYVSVDIFKKQKSVIGICYCIPAFILAGFEHSIADMFYICCSGIFTLQSLIFIFVVVAGNTVGSLMHKFLK